jgi:hypothetical protein
MLHGTTTTLVLDLSALGPDDYPTDNPEFCDRERNIHYRSSGRHDVPVEAKSDYLEDHRECWSEPDTTEEPSNEPRSGRGGSTASEPLADVTVGIMGSGPDSESDGSEDDSSPDVDSDEVEEAIAEAIDDAENVSANLAFDDGEPPKPEGSRNDFHPDMFIHHKAETIPDLEDELDTGEYDDAAVLQSIIEAESRHKDRKGAYGELGERAREIGAADELEFPDHADV